jgi:hypothetical protein
VKRFQRRVNKYAYGSQKKACLDIVLHYQGIKDDMKTNKKEENI